ncbi:mediator of RNA polymerase II transcription subunit 27 isoform X2 [Acinonyx jubatus]|uniref:Mediator of RNA polymerase II transcription subunit 27 n=1 Tax=Acinonyx jubatus TaxID=32536 RepID=A0ABM3NLZ3_ACIJB|nr:mediator of RNA polymerase II transcription subunit 27 isoform X2 [Acinonyx jubatus]
MADVLSVGVNLEAFAQAISAIQALRSSVSRVFDCLKDGMRNKETLEGREKAFIAHFQDNLHSVNRDLNELERLSNLVGKPSENHPLHNSGLLSLDPVQDKTPLYSQLLQAYKWSNKLQYHAGLASGLLNQQSLKRSANQMGVSAKRRPKAQPTTLVLPPQYVDDVISRIDRMFPEMSIHLSRPNGTSAMLLLDIWSKSNYQVFQKVTDHATTALLHYQLPQMPDVVVRSFMVGRSLSFVLEETNLRVHEHIQQRLSCSSAEAPKYSGLKNVDPSRGRLGGSVGEASDFGSGHDLAVRGFEPHVGLCADSLAPASDSVSPSLSAPPPLTLCLPLSQK